MNGRWIVAVAISIYGVVLVIGLVAPMLLVVGYAGSSQHSSAASARGSLMEVIGPTKIGAVASAKFSH